MGESLETWDFRKMLNAWPCYWGTCGKVTFIAHDWSEARVVLSLHVRTRNYVGTSLFRLKDKNRRSRA